MSQTTFISLLRGINMMQYNRIKMPALQQIFVDLGHTDVVTYIQSGNVVFKSKLKEVKTISDVIVEKINKDYGYSIKGQVLTKLTLADVYQSNPFLDRKDIDFSKLHFTLLNEMPLNDILENIRALNKNDDEFIAVKNYIYLYCPNGYGRTKFTNNIFENKLKCQATTRNWRTITKLTELCKA